MRKQSIFYQAWRDCLRQHYLYVISTDDHITEPTLRQVLISTGFTEEELDTLRQEALHQRESQAQEMESA